MSHIAAMDLFVVPTIGFIQLYVLVLVRLARRELVWINVTAHPTAECIAQQIIEAFPWNEHRAIEHLGVITSRLVLGGLHHIPWKSRLGKLSFSALL
jgi:hypothetical protein